MTTYIQEIKKVLPIYFGDYKMELLKIQDIKFCTNEYRKEYFNEFLDFKFNKDITYSELNNALKHRVNNYITCNEKTKEFRLLLKNKENLEICGGATVVFRDNNEVELAYWITPEYQHIGLGYSMILNTINKLINSNICVSNIFIRIQDKNKASIKLAEKLGFKLRNRYNGKYTDILVYSLK